MMALELYMLGLIVQDMGKSLEFYRRLGLAIPEGSEGKTHVQIKMGSGLTFFLDSNPALWDSSFSRTDDSGREEATGPYRSVLEFYLKTEAAVQAKYAELTGLGYQGYRAPYKTSFGMCFALMKDPDGNTLLLSGDLEESAAAQAG
jgi:catechol 2,3-dioxygenase-like lactoylglutathione lyase family enzyme